MIGTTEPTLMVLRCPRCQGQMFRDVEDEYSCLACGEHVFVQRRRPVMPQAKARRAEGDVMAKTAAA